MKRLIVCCDGTWQTLRSSYPTNVVKIAQAIKTFDPAGLPQIVYYDEGIGSDNKADSVLGGAFAAGLSKNIQDAYQFLCFNYDPGDEIYLFGFSRGAYTVRSLAGLMSYCGLVTRSQVRKTPEAYAIYRELNSRVRREKGQNFQQQYGYSDPAKITLLCCWDTVGSVGIPDITPYLAIDKKINRQYGFHDTALSSIISNALHAVAIDEDREAFQPTMMQRASERQNLRQVWFAGVHGCIGGGTEATRGLSDGALLWAIEAIADLGLGLVLDLSQVGDGIQPDALVPFQTTREQEGFGLKKLVWHFTGLSDREIKKFDKTPEFHRSVQERWQKKPDYRPQNLLPFKTELERS